MLTGYDQFKNDSIMQGFMDPKKYDLQISPLPKTRLIEGEEEVSTIFIVEDGKLSVKTLTYTNETHKHYLVALVFDMFNELINTFSPNEVIELKPIYSIGLISLCNGANELFTRPDGMMSAMELSAPTPEWWVELSASINSVTCWDTIISPVKNSSQDGYKISSAATVASGRVLYPYDTVILDKAMLVNSIETIVPTEIQKVMNIENFILNIFPKLGI